MKPLHFKESPEDEEWWSDEEFQYSESKPTITVTINTEGPAPTAEQVAKANQRMKEIESLILQASEHILENYSYDHFKSLGVAEENLVQETNEAIAQAVKLDTIYFAIIDDEEEIFEMSFSVPWDEYHSFDVEFEDGEATTCAVNG